MYKRQVEYCTILTAWPAEQSTKIPAFPEFVASVLLLIVDYGYDQRCDLTISLQEIVRSNTSRIEEILYARVLRTYCINSESVHDEM